MPNTTLREQFNLGQLDRDRLLALKKMPVVSHDSDGEDRHHLIEFRGERKRISTWAREIGMKRSTLYERIMYRKMSAEAAFTTPVRQTKNVRREGSKALTITYKGETKTIVEWAKEKKISDRALYARVFAYNWDIETALNKPVKKQDYSRMFTALGKTQSLDDWSRETGLSKDCLRSRLYLLGWSLEETFSRPRQRDCRST